MTTPAERSATMGLHVVPQHTHHADAEIVGTAEALTALRDAISCALQFGDADMDTFCSDGEGYTLTVRNLAPAAFAEARPYYAVLRSEAAADEIERMRSWLEGDCSCPCCAESRECADDCTFSSDCPDQAERMAGAREAVFGAER